MDRCCSGHAMSSGNRIFQQVHARNIYDCSIGIRFTLSLFHIAGNHNKGTFDELMDSLKTFDTAHCSLTPFIFCLKQ